MTTADPAPLSILHVVESLDRGGLERVVCDLVREQRVRGHTVEVLCLFHLGGFAAELERAGISVFAADKRRGPDLRALTRIRRVIRAGRHQLVHTHNAVANYYTCAAQLFARGSPPVVNTRHNMGALDPRDRRERLFRWCIPLTARFAFVSKRAAERYMRDAALPAERTRVVTNGIPTERYIEATIQSRNTARDRLGLPRDAVVLGTVGRLVEVKNHRLLLDAAAPMCRTNPGLLVVLIGDGPLRAELEGAAAELGIAGQVRLIGERPDVPDLLPAFDVFVLPSVSEGQSIALLEAAAAGLPAVATDVGGNPEILSDGATGLLVPSGDRGALSAALGRLVAAPQLARKLGSAARNWVMRNASVSAMADSYDALYRDVVSDAPVR